MLTAQVPPEIYQPDVVLRTRRRAARLHRRDRARRPDREPRHPRGQRVVVRAPNFTLQCVPFRSFITCHALTALLMSLCVHQRRGMHAGMHDPGYVTTHNGESPCEEDNCLQWISPSRVAAFTRARVPASEPAVRQASFSFT